MRERVARWTAWPGLARGASVGGARRQRIGIGRSGAVENRLTRAVRADDEDDHRFLLRPVGTMTRRKGARGDRTSTAPPASNPASVVMQALGARTAIAATPAKFTARPARKVRPSPRAPSRPRKTPRPPTPSCQRGSSVVRRSTTPYPAPPHPRASRRSPPAPPSRPLWPESRFTSSTARSETTSRVKMFIMKADAAHPGKFDFTYNVEQVLKDTVPEGKGWQSRTRRRSPSRAASPRSGARARSRCSGSTPTSSSTARWPRRAPRRRQGRPEGKLGSFGRHRPRAGVKITFLSTRSRES